VQLSKSSESIQNIESNHVCGQQRLAKKYFDSNMREREVEVLGRYFPSFIFSNASSLK